MTARAVLLDCFRAALAAVDARRCVHASLTTKPLAGDWHVVAVGKAAAAMAFGAVEAMGPRLRGGRIVVPPGHVPAGFEPSSHGLDVLVAAHPMPDARSLAAGEAVAHFVQTLPADARVLFLVSGGASALLEWPRDGVTLDDLALVNRWALTSGAPIATVNAVRRRLSRLKDGGLASLTGARRTVALMISDVPRDDPRVLGSGLLHASPLLQGETPPPGLPPELRALWQRVGVVASEAPPSSTRRVPVRMVATLRTACAAAATRARALGHVPRIERARLDGAAVGQGVRIATKLSRLPPRAVLVAGGETTVAMPANPGRGGRNQHLALAAAIELEARGARRVSMLAAGTDGIDGASDDAGALVDADTCLRGRDAGFDPHVSLAGADSGSLLEASGDLLHTGATLTNVGDLVLGLVSEPDDDEE
ncbi:MAG TPA: DUF4147 domain-containing protein [Steroidobacteraceae bacterium]|nr:DUF4147 domain-containing protein [Steroidobacteraceae bacterium]